MLWDRVPEFQARASFRQAFRELVVAFGPLADELISADRETHRAQYRRLLDRCARGAPPEFAQGAHRSELAAYCQGELLEELDGVSVAFDQWLLSERTRFIERCARCSRHELSQAHGDNPQRDERAEIARRLIMFDPTHEGASRILMRALADMGERAQALREYAPLPRSAEGDASTSSRRRRPYALYEAIRMFAARRGRAGIAVPAAAAQEAAEGDGARARTAIACASACCRFSRPRPLGDDGLALSLSQEIAPALARFRWFDVVAPMALMRRAAARPDQRRRPCGRTSSTTWSTARCRSDGEKYQISVRLLDLTHYATPVWSDRFELGVDELHRLDEVVTRRSSGGSIRSSCSSRASRSGARRPARPACCCARSR